ncbi:MAG: pilus assembly protein PilM [Patescibacteria group bacterium]
MKQSLFRSLFPTPRFLQMPSVGLDISDKSVRFLGFVEGKGGFILGNYAEKKINPGIVESGKIKDERKIKEVLVTLKSEHKLDFVRVALPEEQAYLFLMNVPLVKKRQLRESILFQLEEHVPIKATDAVFDYEIINERADSFVVQVSVIPIQLVESYARIFTESGLRPVSFEVEAQAIARAVIPRGDRGTYMVVDFGQTRTGISIVSEGSVLFTSTIDVGGAMLTEAIAKEFGVDAREAEKIKRERGLGQEKENKKIFSAIISTVAIFRDEINKHFIYWHTHKETDQYIRRPIEKLILCGGDSNLHGLIDYLARSLRMKVELANVWGNVSTPLQYIPEIAFRDSLTYATAVGLALADQDYD